eukprot:s1289_g2.t2
MAKLRPSRLDVLTRHLRQSPASGDELSLVKAAKAQDVVKCEEALAKGADVHARDQFGYTALHWAANHGLLELCKLLREKGADAWLQCEIDPRSNWDETPLIMAARSQKSLPTCDFLVSEGADMQAKTNYSKGPCPLQQKASFSGVEKGCSHAVNVTATTMCIGTVGNTDPIVEGTFDRKVDPHGENYSWFLVPDEDTLEMTLDKDSSEVYQTYSYGTLLWPRLFNDDIPLGEGLFEADLTDLPQHLLEKFQTDQARSDEQSQKERQRRQMMTEEEIAEETARLWNDEFARHGIPHRVDSLEDRRMDSYQK